MANDTDKWGSDDQLVTSQADASDDSDWGSNDKILDGPKHGGFGSAIRYGIVGAGAGLGHTASALGYNQLGNSLSDAAEAYRDPTYDPATSQFSVTSPSTYSYAPRALVEGISRQVPAIAGGAIGGAMTGGPIGAVAGGAVGGFSSGYGDDLGARMANQPAGAAPSASDQAIAALTSAGTGALTAVGPGRLGLNTAVTALGADAVPSALGALGKSAAIDAGTNAAIDTGQQIANTAGTTKGLTIDPGEIANAGALGAVGGVASRGVGLIPDVVQTTKLAPFAADPENTAALQSRLQDANGDTSTPTGAYEAMSSVKTDLGKDLKEIQSGKGYQPDQDGPVFDAKPLLEDLSPYDRRTVNDSVDQVQSGGQLSDDQKAQLANSLGNDQDGSALLGLIQQHDLYNRLAAMGTMNDKAGTFGGGFQATAAYQLSNPLNLAKAAVTGHIGPSVLGGGLLAEAAAHGLGAGLGTIAGPVAAAIPTVALAARGIMRGTDSLTGNADPLGQFMQRTQGIVNDTANAPPAPALPSVSDQIVQQALAAQQAKAAALKQSQVDAAYQANNAVDPISQQRQADFQRALTQQAQQLPPSITDAAKARQIAQMWQAAQAQENAAGGPQGYSNQDAQTAIASEIQRRAQASAAILQLAARQKALQDAMANPQPIDPSATPQAQPKFTQAPAPDAAPSPDPATADPLAPPPILDGSIRARALAAMAARQQAGSDTGPAQGPTPQQATGDVHTFQGIDYPIPATVYRPGYIRSLENKQTAIDAGFNTAMENATPQTQNALQDDWMNVKQARNQDNARGFINNIVRNANPADRNMLRNTFDDDFFKTWRKKNSNS